MPKPAPELLPPPAERRLAAEAPELLPEAREPDVFFPADPELDTEAEALPPPEGLPPRDDLPLAEEPPLLVLVEAEELLDAADRPELPFVPDEPELFPPPELFDPPELFARPELFAPPELLARLEPPAFFAALRLFVADAPPALELPLEAVPPPDPPEPPELLELPPPLAELPPPESLSPDWLCGASLPLVDVSFSAIIPSKFCSGVRGWPPTGQPPRVESAFAPALRPSAASPAPRALRYLVR